MEKEQTVVDMGELDNEETWEFSKKETIDQICGLQDEVSYLLEENEVKQETIDNVNKIFEDYIKGNLTYVSLYPILSKKR